MRRTDPLLIAGELQPVRSRNDVIAFKRVCEENAILIALNTVHQPRLCDWRGRGALLLSIYLDEEQTDLSGPPLLRPDEGIIVKFRT
jgi:alpha-glucosidase